MAPVYGLAECSVGLAFQPLGRKPVIDRVNRDQLRSMASLKRRVRTIRRRWRSQLAASHFQAMSFGWLMRRVMSLASVERDGSSFAAHRPLAAISTTKPKLANFSMATGSTPATAVTLRLVTSSSPAVSRTSSYVRAGISIRRRSRKSLPLIERKALLEPLVANKAGLQFNGHDTGDGELILKHAGKLGFEGVVSKTIDAPYAPGNRGLWRKSKVLNRQEFAAVGWSDPEGSRPYLGALLLGYYTDDGRLLYAGRAGTGMPVKVLADLRRRLDPLARKTSPLSVPPPRSTRFGSPLETSRPARCKRSKA